MARSVICQRFQTSKDDEALYCFLFLAVIAAFPTHCYAGKVNTSIVLIWSTKNSNGRSVLAILKGDPMVYVPQMQSNWSSPSYLFDDDYFSLDGTSALETNYAKTILYYYYDNDLYHSTKFLILYDTESVPLTVLPLSNQVTGISFDWISSLLYWSDAGYHRIGVINTENNFFWRIMVDSNISEPQSVVVYPQQSYLFWIDLGDEPKIERLDLARDERRVLVSNGTVQQPKTLAIDFANRRLFWLDPAAATIGSINLDGTKISLWTLSLFSFITSFVLYQDYILLGNNAQSSVYIYNATDRQYWAIYRNPSYLMGINGMTMWSPERQSSISNGCTYNNGGCDHFCVAVNSSRKCLCAMGYFLGSDGFKCLTKSLAKNHFLLMTDVRQRNIFQVDVDTGEVRAITDNLGVNMTAMDFDPVGRCIYWFDDTNKQILKTALDNGNKQTVLRLSGIEIESLAFDNVTRTLFYADYQQSKAIGQILLSSKTTKTLLQEKDSKPTAIVLDTNSRLLYWSDCGSKTIERGKITSPDQGRSSVVTGLTSCVNTFAIDFRGQYIYWGDEYGFIRSANLDGTSIKEISTDTSANYKGLALDANSLYISDANKRQIQKLDRVTYQISNLTALLFTRPWALIFYTNESMLPTVSSTVSSTVSPTVSPIVGNEPSMKLTIIIVVPVVGGSVILILITVCVAFLIIRKRRNAHKSSRLPLPPPPPIPTYDDLKYSSGYDTLEVTGTLNEAMYSTSKNEGYLSGSETFSVELRQISGRPSIGCGNGCLVPEDGVHQDNRSPSTATYDNVIPKPDDSQHVDDRNIDTGDYI